MLKTILEPLDYLTPEQESFLQAPDIANLKPRFEDWDLVKAQALITGKVSYTEEKLE